MNLTLTLTLTLTFPLWCQEFQQNRPPCTMGLAEQANQATNPRCSDDADPSFLPLWFSGHIAASQATGKPLVLEEFGRIASTDATNISITRDPVF